MKKKVVLLLVFFSFLAEASSSGSSYFERNEDDFIYNDYYKVRESFKSGRLNLMNLEHINEVFPLPEEPYKRDVHFGGWLRDKIDGTCLNTRGKVLVRDAVQDVEYSSNGCTVLKGEWNDPYTGSPRYTARELQIDHVVALKNAYMSGAHEWDFNKRCLYANYMGNDFHLLSVDGPENLKKSDNSPTGYVPPNRRYTCTFLKQWLYIKLIWSLRLTPKESTSIQRLARENGCSARVFEVTQEDLNDQRRYMENHADLCDSSLVGLESF